MSTEPLYDVFISYSSRQQDWVEVLASNLRKHGVNPFFDKWTIIPGENIQAALAHGIRHSRAGILVATPESLDSGWVQQEYTRLSGRRRDEPSFRLVPIAFGEVPCFDFLEDSLVVHFDENDDYEWAFHTVLSGLKGVPPGPRRMLKMDLDLPRVDVASTTVHSFAQRISEQALTHRALLLLGQADSFDGHTTKAAIDEIRRVFDDFLVFDIAAPITADSESRRYFAKLAARCGFGNDVDSDKGFEDELERVLLSEKKVLLLLRSFENGPEHARYQTAAILRNLYDSYDGFRFILTGGKSLADLYFVDHSASPIRFAKLERWPDYSADDISDLGKQAYALDLNRDQTYHILRLSGGHLRLIHLCLDLYRTRGVRNGSIAESDLVGDLAIDQIVAPLLWNVELIPRIRSLQQITDLGVAAGHLTDESIRELFWWNLLKEVEGHLEWRCSLLRDYVGKVTTPND